MQFGRLRFVLILALLASNLLVGVLSLFFLRSMDQRYGALFDRSVAPINSLRTLTRELSSVQRLARRAVDPDNETAWAGLLPQMDEASNAVLVHALEISRADLFRETRHHTVLGRIAKEYDQKVDKFLVLARAKQLTEANKFNVEELRPCYDSYQLALDAAADYVQQQGSDLRDRYAEDTRMFGGFLLAFAGWPLLAAGVLIIVMGLLVVGLFAAVFFPRLFASKETPA
ncbi:MAG: MCP four helix bundle domain-containing protein [bacterium]|nr:MCP four helix bundle domain-containing protein [bacterium]MDI1338095.1 MCP four helix bundle domain-containing protein [Lacunisphaera sp.]